MDNITSYDITEAMIRYGGSFMQGLGKLYRQADADNRQRLEAAFPEYFTQYAEVSLLHAQSRAAMRERLGMTGSVDE